VYLSRYPDSPQPTEEIAEATKVPAPYLSKVLQAMAKSGLVKSHRGLHGGFSLVKDPQELTILEVVNSVDPIKRIKICPLGLESHGVNLCPLHFRVDQALAEVERAFAATTLAEVLAEPTTSVPLCNFPIKPGHP
ncbi:MAG TPA: Rrf2 family transcriptional regulator, partial [Planctomycetaceae bacterium]|nr:Rrf2 family transcriptional regulator [Planctomycetaceae bacterium]